MAQEPRHASLTLETNPSGADVFIDSSYIGKTPLEDHRLAPGVRIMRLFYPSALAWHAIAKSETLHVAAGSRIVRHVDVGTFTKIVSEPAGARVLLGGIEIGRTPLVLRRPHLLKGEVVIEKEGYVPQRIDLSLLTFPFIVKLQAESEALSSTQGEILPADYMLGASDHWLTYASASSMIVSGIVSAYLKNKANSDFDRYLLTKDPALLASTRRLDRWAAASFVVTQISFAVLTYILLSD
jgi:hypothetical protein